MRNPSGSGSVFYFEIPYVPFVDGPDPGVGGLLAVPDLPEAPSGGPSRVLLIDDTKVLLEMQALELQLEGFVVTQAYGAIAGLELLKTQKFDLTLCDYQMMEMNGCELTSTFREWESIHRPNGPYQVICCLTAYPSVEMKELCVQSGMQDVLTKPLCREMESVWHLIRLTPQVPVSDSGVT